MNKPVALTCSWLPQSVNLQSWFFQIDVCAEELHNSRKAEVALLGDVAGTVQMINALLNDWTFPDSSSWWSSELKLRLYFPGIRLKQTLRLRV